MPQPPFDADICVIGAGTAGLHAFDEIDRLGKSVLLVDHGPLGTMCARVGCMPSKAALHAGHRALVASQVSGEEPPGHAIARLWSDALAFRDRMAGGAADSTRERAGDRLVCGTARFIHRQTIEVDTGTGSRRIRARAFIVAVGSRPVVPKPFAELGDRVLTTDSLFSLDALPASMGVVGTGAIGIEMGLAMARLGVDVTAADESGTPAGIDDPEVAERAARRFGRELDLWLGHGVEAKREGDGVRMTSGSRSVVVERLLVAVGRKPQLAELDLGNAGVSLDEKGGVDVDRSVLRCGDTALFMAGDANGEQPLLHEAVDDGMICARQAVALVDGQPLEYYQRRVPFSIVFSDPDVASVGTPFKKLDAESIVVGTTQGSDNGRAILLEAEDSLLHLYAERRGGRLLGATVFCKHGEHIAHLLAWAVQRGETVASLLQMPYYHPSVEEMVQAALRDAAERIEGGSVDAAGLVLVGASSA